MKIKVMIAEDERMVREELAYFIQQEEDMILCPSAENGRQLIELYRQYEPDVIFLDIEMPSLSGVEVARRLKNQNNLQALPLFVFTTAYDDYAVEAFDLEAIDYLLKPYDYERFKEALSRIRKHISKLATEEEEDPDTSDSFASGSFKSKLIVEDGEKMIVVSPESIYYAVRSDRHIKIFTDKKVIQTKMTLQELEQKLNGYPFFRPHRSYLVNLDCIQEITPWFNGAYNLILKDKENTQIPVSRSSAKPLFDLFQQ
ncbi:MAG: response regulator transcription factor [Bacillaceae bacterium]|nr:response regulator transcription factor [Bacillaceae bacterium]